MPARGGGPPNNGQRSSWLIGPASSMAGLAQTAQQWSVRAARSVCGWYHCTPLGGVRKVRTQEKMYTHLYRLGDRWVRKLERIAQPRSAFRGPLCVQTSAARKLSALSAERHAMVAVSPLPRP